MTSPLLPENTVFSVTQITELLKEMIEGTFPSIIIEAEISNYRPNSSGHMYFTLKDSSAQLSAVMFRGKAMGLGFVPKDGMLVRCKGQLTVYAARGNYQIIISSMELAGEGNILLMLEQRKKMLAEEGLFDENRKRALPSFPKTVGVVTSATGAALRDILQIIRRRNNCISVIIFPSVVQGEDAAESITQQIKIANYYKMCDVLIVGRGGGSLEDLLPFSDENVVRAIATSTIPVVSAIGHEIDWALSDFASDKRAPTPSAAAELVSPVKDDVLEYLKNRQNDLLTVVKSKVENLKLMIKSFSSDNMEIKFRTIEQPLLYRFDNSKEALLQNMSLRLKDTKQYIEKQIQILEGASPKTILARGYSMVRDKTTGKIIRSPEDTKIGSELEIVPARGSIIAKVLKAE